MSTLIFPPASLPSESKNLINKLQQDGTWVSAEEDKADIVFSHFNSILGDFEERAHGLNFSALTLPVLPPVAIDHCFFKEEVWAVISEMLADKAPGPDGFIGLFYQAMWPVIKADIMNAFHAFWSLDFRSFFLVNQAYITLLQKKKRYYLCQGLQAHKPYSQFQQTVNQGSFQAHLTPDEHLGPAESIGLHQRQGDPR
jgi:hypothetical protein